MSLFINQGGRVACSKHGGFYLERLIERDEKLNKAPKEYTTPLDSWVRVDDLTIEQFTLKCEECPDA